MKTQPETEPEERLPLAKRIARATTWHLWLGLGIVFIKQLSGWSEREDYYLRMHGKVTLTDHLGEIAFTTLFGGLILAVVFYVLDRVVRRIAKSGSTSQDSQSDGPRPRHPVFVAAEWAIQRAPIRAARRQDQNEIQYVDSVEDFVGGANSDRRVLSPSSRRELLQGSSTFCVDCGNELPAALTKFCPECGTPAGRELERVTVASDDDELESQPHGPKNLLGRRRLALFALAFVMLVVGDWFLRNREMAQLLDATEKSEEAMTSASYEMYDAVRDFEARPYPSGTFGGGPTSEDFESLRAEVRGAASVGVRDVMDTSDQVAGVSVLPWHRSIQKAKSRYLDHADTWEDRFSAVAGDAERLYDETPEIGATFKIAERGFAEALTPFTLFGVQERVEAIFAN